MNADNYWSAENLAHLDSNQGCAVVMRHSLRTPITCDAEVYTADLTEEGWQAARAWGARVASRWQIDHVYCSPIQRCVHTSQAILDGAGITLPVRQKWWLFSPFLEHQNADPLPEARLEISRRLIYSQYSLRRIIEQIRVPPQAGHLNIYVAHDSSVLPLLAYLEGWTEIPSPVYPNCLHGIVLRRGEWGTELVRRLN